MRFREQKIARQFYKFMLRIHIMALQQDRNFACEYCKKPQSGAGECMN